jgi:hypothetical protein
MMSTEGFWNIVYFKKKKKKKKKKPPVGGYFFLHSLYKTCINFAPKEMHIQTMDLEAKLYKIYEWKVSQNHMDNL